MKKGCILYDSKLPFLTFIDNVCALACPVLLDAATLSTISSFSLNISLMHWESPCESLNDVISVDWSTPPTTIFAARSDKMKLPIPISYQYGVTLVDFITMYIVWLNQIIKNFSVLMPHRRTTIAHGSRIAGARCLVTWRYLILDNSWIVDCKGDVSCLFDGSCFLQKKCETYIQQFTVRVFYVIRFQNFGLQFKKHRNESIEFRMKNVSSCHFLVGSLQLEINTIRVPSDTSL